jgi:hypothetical protein
MGNPKANTALGSVELTSRKVKLTQRQANARSRESESKRFSINVADNYSMELRLSDTLSALIKEKRLTLREVAEKCGVWQSGRAPKNPIQVAKVADCLGVSMYWLLFGTEDKQGLGVVEKIIRDEVFTGNFQISVKRIRIQGEDS